MRSNPLTRPPLLPALAALAALAFLPPPAGAHWTAKARPRQAPRAEGAHRNGRNHGHHFYRTHNASQAEKPAALTEGRSILPPGIAAREDAAEGLAAETLSWVEAAGAESAAAAQERPSEGNRAARVGSAVQAVARAAGLGDPGREEAGLRALYQKDGRIAQTRLAAGNEARETTRLARLTERPALRASAPPEAARPGPRRRDSGKALTVVLVALLFLQVPLLTIIAPAQAGALDLQALLQQHWAGAAIAGILAAFSALHGIEYFSAGEGFHRRFERKADMSDFSKIIGTVGWLAAMGAFVLAGIAAPDPIGTPQPLPDGKPGGVAPAAFMTFFMMILTTIYQVVAANSGDTTRALSNPLKPRSAEQTFVHAIAAGGLLYGSYQLGFLWAFPFLFVHLNFFRRLYKSDIGGLGLNLALSLLSVGLSLGGIAIAAAQTSWLMTVLWTAFAVYVQFQVLDAIFAALARQPMFTTLKEFFQ